MKQVLLPALALPLLLGSCDHIDAVGDKVNELKDMRKESMHGVEGMDLKAITGGIAKTGPTVQDLSETEFGTFIAEPGRLNIVDFHAEWCGPCKMLGPILTEVVEANAHVVRLGKINVDQAQELAREEGVSSIPDVRFYVDGKVVHKFVGAPSRAKIEELIATHSAGINPVADLTDALVNDKGDGTSSAPPTRPPNAKPIEEALKPMDKNWLPPGVSQKK
ncbi:MAG: thioredoxin [Verrucomicrobiota bacterium]